MAKRIKFPLKMKNGAEVRTLDELKENYDLESVLGYFADGRLATWLADRYYDDLCNAINSLNTNDDGFQEALCKCLGIEYISNEYYNLSEISRQRERLTYLKSIIADENILKHSNSIALNQEELLAKINEGHKDIYIGKGTFEISLLYENITYHGFENPIVTILATDNVNFKAKNINFENIVFGWDVSKVSDDDEMLIAEKNLRENKWQSVLPILQKYAEMNHPRAILLLERIFFSYDSNDELQKKYSEQGQKLCSVQSFIMNGTDITNNHLAILKYLADKGNLLDMTLYGYTLREFGKKNNNYQTNDIYSYLSAAADGGEPWAMTLLGYCYQYYGFEQNYSKALEWYKKAADTGYISACGSLGSLYGEGLGVEKDYAESFKWFSKAAEQNAYWCQGNLGLYYEKGFGVSIDYDKAVHWYRKAADGGNIWSVKN